MQWEQVREGRRCIFLFGELRVYVKVMYSLTSVHSEMGKMMSDSLTALSELSSSEQFVTKQI
jgi:hypothetical protein